MDSVVVIQAEVSAYSAKSAAESTLTIGELKELLENYDDDTKVVLSFSRGYSFGGISEYDFSEENVDE